jgi:hypothetical protein
MRYMSDAVAIDRTKNARVVFTCSHELREEITACQRAEQLREQIDRDGEVVMSRQGPKDHPLLNHEAWRPIVDCEHLAASWPRPRADQADQPASTGINPMTDHQFSEIMCWLQRISHEVEQLSSRLDQLETNLNTLLAQQEKENLTARWRRPPPGR